MNINLEMDQDTAIIVLEAIRFRMRIYTHANRLSYKKLEDLSRQLLDKIAERHAPPEKVAQNFERGKTPS